MSYTTPAIRLDESGMWVLRKYHEAEVERLMRYLHNATHRAIVPFKDCRMCAAIRKEPR